MKLFGFEITREKDKEELESFVAPNTEDGSLSLAAGTGSLSYIDLEGAARTEAELVSRYRSMLQQPEVQQSVDDIVNETVNITYDEKPVEINTDDLELSASIKKKIAEEFDNVLRLLDFSNEGYDIFLKWYVDGRIYYHAVIDENNLSDGIKELRYIDPRKIRKIREFEKVKIGDGAQAYYISKIKNEYFLFNEQGFMAQNQMNRTVQNEPYVQGLKIAKDSIVHCTSGLLNENSNIIISHLHKAYKPLNQLRMMEDSAVIYRITRAPERRVFYIDVGNLPKMKAEQYLKSMMTNHKNRLVYDASTGEVRDDRKFMTMTDDFWLPRRGDSGRGTQIDTLAGGQNLDQIEDIQYFQRRLYKSLNVPISRMESETMFNLGRASEITRDEVKFSKFVRRLRAKFSILFDRILEKQLILKNIITPEEWVDIKDKIRYDFQLDNQFEEFKQAEILRERFTLVRDVDEYVGTYISRAYVRKKILQLSDEDIEEIRKEIEKEKKEEPGADDDDEDNEMEYSNNSQSASQPSSAPQMIQDEPPETANDEKE